MSGKSLLGYDETLRWADMIVNDTRKKIVNAFESSSKKMVKSARSRNKNNFTSKKYDDAIKSDVVHRDNMVSLTFYIDTKVKGVILDPSGYNLLWLQNDGTYGNYRRGIISPTAITVGGNKGTGILGSDFMGRTWRTQYKALNKRLEEIMDGVK